MAGKKQMTLARIRRHPVLSFPDRRAIRFKFAGRSLSGLEGDTIASALHAAGIRILSHSPRYQRPRGFFCAIGRCSSCFVHVYGVPNVRACVTYLEPGMEIMPQRGRGAFGRAKAVRPAKRSEKTRRPD
ncbi:MAG: (2Fe-2S)-binding protein [Planctomycetota bacterium]|nr:(2Fe-2S)-binding protein [Planctomycetota bacterium]